MNSPLRVTMTLEQCWHRVPGGTAVAGIGMARAVDARADAIVTGVSARHRSAPPAAWSPPVEVAQLPLPRLALYETWHRFRRPKVQTATGPTDVIHATSLAMPPRSAPLVVHIHDLAFLHDPSHFTPRGVRFFDRGLALARAEADLVLCPSTATILDCTDNGFERERLRLVPLGVDVDPASAEQIAAVRERHGLTRPYVMWTGTIEPRKNLPRLLEAFDRVEEDVDLALVGPEGWNEDVRALLGNRDRVKVLGFVPQADLDALYAGAEVFCFPSLFEGFGLPVLEAMAQGTPVVTSRGTSTEELGEDAAILVEPRDVGSIAEGITTALKDEGLRRRLKAAGPRRASGYRWETTADLLMKAYGEVVE
ncbi:MAG: glycosyltransferase family 4 protein [Actinomycetota bacterium]